MLKSILASGSERSQKISAELDKNTKLASETATEVSHLLIRSSNKEVLEIYNNELKIEQEIRLVREELATFRNNSTAVAGVLKQLCSKLKELGDFENYIEVLELETEKYTLRIKDENAGMEFKLYTSFKRAISQATTDRRTKKIILKGLSRLCYDFLALFMNLRTAILLDYIPVEDLSFFNSLLRTGFETIECHGAIIILEDETVVIGKYDTLRSYIFDISVSRNQSSAKHINNTIVRDTTPILMNSSVTFPIPSLIGRNKVSDSIEILDPETAMANFFSGLNSLYDALGAAFSKSEVLDRSIIDISQVNCNSVNKKLIDNNYQISNINSHRMKEEDCSSNGWHQASSRSESRKKHKIAHISRDIDGGYFANVNAEPQSTIAATKSITSSPFATVIICIADLMNQQIPSTPPLSSSPFTTTAIAGPLKASLPLQPTLLGLLLGYPIIYAVTSTNDAKVFTTELGRDDLFVFRITCTFPSLEIVLSSFNKSFPACPTSTFPFTPASTTRLPQDDLETLMSFSCPAALVPQVETLVATMLDRIRKEAERERAGSPSGTSVKLAREVEVINKGLCRVVI